MKIKVFLMICILILLFLFLWLNPVVILHSIDYDENQEHIEYSITNLSLHRIRYSICENDCLYKLDKLKQWNIVTPKEGEMSSDVGINLYPFQSIKKYILVEKTMDPGKYKLCFSFTNFFGKNSIVEKSFVLVE